MTWTLIRFLHFAGLVFFVGGQLMLAIAVAPAVRRHGTPAAMRAVARRFGMASGAALIVLVATGAALASHLDRWDDGLLHAKLGVLVVVGMLVGLHVVKPNTRLLPVALLVASLAIVWLGVELAHG